MKNRIRLAAGLLAAALPLSSALACGGGFSELEATIYAVQTRTSLYGKVSRRTLLENMEAAAAARAAGMTQAVEATARVH